MIPVVGDVVLEVYDDAVAVFHDHGVDFTAIPVWELPWAVTDETTVVETDPWTARVRIALEAVTDGRASGETTESGGTDGNGAETNSIKIWILEGRSQ